MKRNVNFLVITNNNEETIRECLNAILSLRHCRKKIIVINDHSTDKTEEILSSFGDKIHCIHNQKQIGIGNSKNKGIELAGGKGILFIIDGDIIIESNSVSKIVEIFGNRPNIAGISGYYDSEKQVPNYNSITDLRREIIYQKRGKPFSYGISDFTTFSGGFCALNLDKIKNLIFPDESQTSAEDLIFQISLLNKDLSFMFSPLLVGKHKHIRNVNDILIKVLREAQGSVWAEFEILDRGLQLPKLEQVFSYPDFILFSCSIIKPWIAFITVPLILTPYFGGNFNFSNYHFKGRILLLAYSTIFYILKTIFSIHKFIFGGYKLTTKLKFTTHFLLSPILAKYKWLKREIWLIKH